MAVKKATKVIADKLSRLNDVADPREKLVSKVKEMNKGSKPKKKPYAMAEGGMIKR